MKQFKKSIIVAAMISTSAHAGVESDMADMFNSMGAVTSYTESGAYRSQAANMYTGGGFSAKWGNKTISPFQIQLPSVKGGCGGIDFFSGAFSFANKEQFVQFVRNLGNNAVGVAFDIALSTLDPLIQDKISSIRDLVNRVNGMGLNSCESAQHLVGGLAGMIGEGIKNQCEAKATSSGSAADGAEAKWICSDTSKMISQQLTARSDAINKKGNPNSVSFTGGNTTLYALSKYGISDEEKTWLLSILGTAIVKEPKTGDTANLVEPEFIAPTIMGVEDITRTLGVQGAAKIDITLLECAPASGGSPTTDYLRATSCKPVKKQYTSLKTLVKTRVDALKQGIKAGNNSQAASQGVLSMIQNSEFPLLKMALLDVSTGNDALTDKAINAITYGLAERYLTNLVQAGSEVLGRYPNRDEIERKAMESALKNISVALEGIRSDKQAAYSKLNVESNFSNYIQTVNAQFKAVQPNLGKAVAFSQVLLGK